jgi:hypothetical protein
MREFIKNMADKNIGSLCLFLNNDKNIDYLNEINNNIPKEAISFSISEKVYYYINEIKDIILCSCGENKKFIGYKNGYRKTCGNKKCFVNIRKETCIEKWGVDNPKKSKEILEREKENIKKKWGVDHYMLSEDVKNKFKKTMIEKWGVEWAQQSNEIKKKSLETWENNERKEEIIKKRKINLLNKTKEEKREINDKKIKSIVKKYGSYDNFIKYRLERIKKNSLEKWGVEHHFKNKKIKEKRIKSYKKNILSKIKEDLPELIDFNFKISNKNNTDSILNFKCSCCDKDFYINRQLFVFRKNANENICLNCNPILSGKSKKELEVLDFIKNNYNGLIETNIKDIINGELDIYLPDLKIGFEFNGLYWHSDRYKDKFYHLNKTKEFLEKNKQLIHIWEDDWDFKKDIVKSIILNKIGGSKKIWARKCKIKEITDNKSIRDFLNKNHIQGFVGSNIKIGLYYNDELVSLMTFGSLRKSLGQKKKENSYELLRFCNKLNYSVVGGASKLLTYFIKNHKPSEIISYSDISRGNGDLYERLGFKYLKETDVNYYWVVNGVKKHRFNFRKDVLVKNGEDPKMTEVEIMNKNGFYRIFDCGSKKWSIDL